jgi:hypothetical protein
MNYVTDSKGVELVLYINLMSIPAVVTSTKVCLPEPFT